MAELDEISRVQSQFSSLFLLIILINLVRALAILCKLDLEQYTRRDCLEIIRGMPLPSTPMDMDQTDQVVLKIGEKMGVPIQKSDISISHRIPSRKQFTDEGNPIPPAIKFMKSETRENLCRARRNLRSLSTVDLGYSHLLSLSLIVLTHYCMGYSPF